MEASFRANPLCEKFAEFAEDSMNRSDEKSVLKTSACPYIALPWPIYLIKTTGKKTFAFTNKLLESYVTGNLSYI